MNAKSQLIELAQYLELSRRAGHTTAMMEGAKSADCIVLAHNQAGADLLKTLEPKGKVVALPAIATQLKGERKPLLVDNAAMAAILSLALGEISRLEKKVAGMKKAAQAIADSAEHPRAAAPGE